MSDVPQGPDWWQASDGKWYPPQQHPAAQPPAAAPEPSAGGRRRITGPLIGALVVAVLAGGGAAFLLTQDSGNDDPDGDGDAREVALELASETGLDPFYEGLTPETTDALDSFVETGSADLVGTRLAGTDVGEADGGEPGLYGGSRDETSCDVEQLGEFLAEADDKATAWSGALGVDDDRIDEYLDTLTPVHLTVDTRVVNHGFVDGVATPRDTVLQRGTAVLVDNRGVPRVRCSCGNPLLEPASTDAADDGDGDVEFTGASWSGFDPDRVIVVTVAGDPIDAFELVDVATGEHFSRPAGTDGHSDSAIGDEDGDDSDDAAQPDEPVTHPLQECGVVVRATGEPVTVSTRAPPGADVCPAALELVEDHVDAWETSGPASHEIGEWHCARATGMGLEEDQLYGCHWPDGDARIVVTDGATPDGATPDPGTGPADPADPDGGLGGPGESEACGPVTVNGRLLEVAATGVSCDVAHAVVQRIDEEDSDSFDGEEATWDFDDGWSCRLYGAGLFGECGSEVGFIEITPHVAELG